MTSNYIVFSVAGTSYALPSEQVGHVEMLDHVTRVPNAPPAVDGVVFSRGHVVPAINLRARFGFARASYDMRTRLVVVRAQERMVGLVVDAAREFLAIPDTAIKPPGEGLSGMSGHYLRGIAALDNRMIVVLDLDSILSVDQAAVAAATEQLPRHAEERG